MEALEPAPGVFRRTPPSMNDGKVSLMQHFLHVKHGDGVLRPPATFIIATRSEPLDARPNEAGNRPKLCSA